MDNAIEKSTAAQYDKLICNIGQLITSARDKVAVEVNTTLLDTYWEIGRYIVEFEQNGNARAEYGKGLLKQLAHDLTLSYGAGFNHFNLVYMRKLYQTFEKSRTLSYKLSWSHYTEILKINDELERDFYIRQCELERWNVRELKRQMRSMLFHRIALSKDKEGVLELAKEGQHVQEPRDLLKEPFVWEFVDLPTPERMMELDLEHELVHKFADFMLEMGRGLCLMKEQYPIPINGDTYHCDLVFYHAILKCYVLIDLKRGEIRHEDIGQMNFYLNYFRHEVCQSDDNPPVGIVLGARKDDLVMQYAMEGISNQLFAGKYQLFLPKREELQMHLDMLLEEAERNNHES